MPLILGLAIAALSALNFSWLYVPNRALGPILRRARIDIVYNARTGTYIPDVFPSENQYQDSVSSV